jgi:hypothetical protein
MEALGYTRLADDSDTAPDVVVLVGVSSSENFIAYSSYPYYDYYGWYGGWDYWYGWGGGWYGYYPYYPYPQTVENYTTGSLLIDMIDPSSFDAGEKQVESIWVAGVNGLMEGSQVQRRVISSINQCFNQSPYLGTN